MGANGKSRRWLSRSKWRSPSDLHNGQVRCMDKAIARELAREQLEAEMEDQENG